MSKDSKKDYTRLSVDRLPRRKKDAPQKGKKKLGLVSRNKIIQPVSFRLRPEINRMLKDITQNLVMESRIRLTNTDALELLIIHASKVDVQELLDAPKGENL